MDAQWIRSVRSFNRTITERVGALNDRFLGRNRPIGEARLLWEIGTTGPEIRELRNRLALDSGYISRLLRSLEQQGLVMTDESSVDGRVRHVYLTQAGLSERTELDQRSDDLAYHILEPLTDDQREKLVAAMEEVERLLTVSLVTIVVEDPMSSDARWCVSQYFAELASRFETGFDPALSISADAHELTPPAGIFLVARLREKPVACGALKTHVDTPAEVKRMWVAPSMRGLGLGARILSELERHAGLMGVTMVRLETNRALTEAI